MRTRQKLLAGLIAIALLGACSKDSDSGNGGEGGEGGAAAFKVDSSSPDALAESYAKMLTTGAYDKFPDLVVPEHQAGARAMVPVIKGGAKLGKAYKKAYPDREFPMNQEGGDNPMADMDSFTGAWEVASCEKDADNADQAKATLKAAAGEGTHEIEMTKMDDRWYVSGESLPTEEEIEQSKPMMDAMANLGAKWSEMATKIEEGGFESPEAADEAIKKAQEDMAKEMMAEAMKQMQEQMGEEGAPPLPEGLPVPEPGEGEAGDQ